MQAKRKSAKPRTSKRSPKARSTRRSARRVNPRTAAGKAAKKIARKVLRKKPAAWKATKKAARKGLASPAPRKAALKAAPKAAARRPAAPPAPRHPLGFLELHVSFNTRAFEGLTAFFRDKIGLPAQAMSEMGYVNVDVCKGGSLGFMAWNPVSSEGGEPPAFVAAEAGVYVMCADVEFVYRTLTERGLTFEAPPADMPWGHRLIRTTDPEGRSIAFAQAIHG